MSPCIELAKKGQDGKIIKGRDGKPTRELLAASRHTTNSTSPSALVASVLLYAPRLQGLNPTEVSTGPDDPICSPGHHEELLIENGLGVIFTSETNSETRSPVENKTSIK